MLTSILQTTINAGHYLFYPKLSRMNLDPSLIFIDSIVNQSCFSRFAKVARNSPESRTFLAAGSQMAARSPVI